MPPPSSALKCSAIAPIVVRASTPITMPEIVSALRSLRRAMFLKTSTYVPPFPFRRWHSRLTMTSAWRARAAVTGTSPSAPDRLLRRIVLPDAVGVYEEAHDRGERAGDHCADQLGQTEPARDRDQHAQPSEQPAAEAMRPGPGQLAR